MKVKESLSIISGGSRGIGLDIAKRLSNEGSDVYILDKNLPEGNEIDQNINLNFIKCNLASEKSILDALEQVIFSKGKKIFLINNARFKNKFSMDEPISQWNESIAVTLTAPFILSREVILRSQSGGSIVNICSIASKYATGESPSYHAAKGGLLALSNYLAIEGAKKNFTSNAILPGLIVQKDFLKKFNSQDNEDYKKLCELYQPMGKVGSESDVSDLVIFLLSDEASYLSGSEIKLDGGATNRDHFSLAFHLQNRRKNET